MLNVFCEFDGWIIGCIVRKGIDFYVVNMVWLVCFCDVFLIIDKGCSRDFIIIGFDIKIMIVF